jgi:glutaredoxin
MVSVVLYGKPGCHLCEDARDTLLSVQQKYPFELTELNIMDDEELFNKYVVDIPVVTINGEFFSEYKVDIQKLESTLQSLTKEKINES